MLVLCAGLLAAGCAGQQAEVADGNPLTEPALNEAPEQGADLASALMPPLPLDLPDLRSVALSSPRTLQGDQFISQSVGTAVIGDAMVFHGAVAPAWALYQFSGLYSEDRPYQFSFALEDDATYLPQHLYIGISDFENQTWDWYDAHYPAPTFTFGIPQANLPKPSPSGNIYVCVLTMSEWTMLHSLSMTFDYAPPPVDLRAGDGTSQLGVDLLWTDPDVTYADGPPLAYDGIAIERATSQAGPWEKLTTVARGTTAYLDESALALGPGKLYYRLYLDRGLNPSQPGVPDMGYVNFAPVLTYTTLPMAPSPATGQLSAAGSYDRDGGGLTYEWQFDDGEWESTGPLPLVTHTFFQTTTVHLRVTDEEGTSSEVLFSQPVSGNSRAVRASYPNYTPKYGIAQGFTDGQNYLLQMYAPYGGAFCKLGANFDLKWSKAWTEYIEPYGPCSDGGFYGVGAYSTELDVARFDSTGDLLWSFRYSIAPELQIVQSFKVDVLSRLWIVGTQNSPDPGALICCIGSDGQPLFFKQLDLDDPGSRELYPFHIATDDSGNAVIAFHATIWSPSYITGSFLVKLDGAGKALWQKAIVDSGSQELIQVGGVAWDSPKFYVSASGNSGNYYFSLEEDGTVTWARQSTYPMNPAQVSSGYMYMTANSRIAIVPKTESGVQVHDVWLQSGNSFMGLSYGAPSLMLPYAESNWSRDQFTTWPATLTTADSSWGVTWTDASISQGAWTPVEDEAPAIEIDTDGTDSSVICNTPFGGVPLP